MHFSYNKEIADDKNFSDLLNGMRSVLNTWHQRYLTLGGKIQVFKSLIASKLVYIATMKTVPKHVLDSMQALHRDFIWNSKKPKMKHCTLIGNYSDGGLKDIDLTSKLESLRFSWIKWLRDTTDFHPWKVLANLILKSVGGSSIFQSNLSLSKLTKQRIEQLPLFYVDAINLFIQFAKVEDLSSNDIMSQHLWDNAFILRQNSPIYDPYLSSKGIKTLKDVIDGEGNNRKWEYMSDKYQLKPVDFLSWYGLLNSIPKQWKKKLQIEPAVDNTFDEDRCPLSVNDKVIDISSLTSRQIYGDLVYSKYRAPNAPQYFISKFGQNDIEWSQVYLIPHSTSIDMKTRIFQFKILNNILYLNARLYKMGSVSSSKCSLCSESNETTTHLFFECRVSASLWSAIQNHVQNNQYLPGLSEENVHLGFISNNSSMRLENHILLAFKQFLFDNQKEKFIVNLNGFWKYLMHI